MVSRIYPTAPRGNRKRISKASNEGTGAKSILIANRREAEIYFSEGTSTRPRLPAVHLGGLAPHRAEAATSTIRGARLIYECACSNFTATYG